MALSTNKLTKSTENIVGSVTPDLGENPTSGQVLLLVVSLNVVPTVTITTDHSFTKVWQGDHASGHTAVFWKVSDGTEQDVAITWGGVEEGRVAYWYAELDVTHDTADDHITNAISGSDVDTLDLGTIASANRDQDAQLAIVGFGTQNDSQWNAGNAISDGFTVLDEQNADQGNRPAIIVGYKELSASGDVNPVVSTTDSGEQCSGVCFLLYTSAAGEDLIKIFNEDIEANEGVISCLARIRITNETTQVAEGLVRSAALVRLQSDTTELAEGVSRSAALVRILGEDVSLGETIVRAFTLVRLRSESVNLSEVVARLRDRVRLHNETSEIEEALETVRLLTRQVNETGQLSEDVARTFVLTRQVNESVQLTEGLLRLRTLIRQIGETLQTAEDVQRHQSLVRLFNEVVNQLENLERARQRVRLVDETSQIAESLLRALAKIRIVGDTLQVSETRGFVRQIIVIVAEALNIAESISRTLSDIVVVVQSITKLLASKLTKGNLFGSKKGKTTRKGSLD